MITNLKTLTGKGLRHITIGAKDSLADYGALITRDTRTDSFMAKSGTDDLPWRDGLIDGSTMNGRLFFEPRELAYRFKLAGMNAAALEASRNALYNWLKGVGKCDIADSKYTENVNGVGVQWLFTNCVLKSLDYEIGDKNAEVEYCYVTALIVCDPYLKKSGTGKERIFKFTANTNASISITNGQNQSYTIMVGEDTTTSTFTAADPQKYRLIAYTENAAMITLNGVALATDTIFTMPASATIAITHTGLGYYELWHDTEEVRL